MPRDNELAHLVEAYLAEEDIEVKVLKGSQNYLPGRVTLSSKGARLFFSTFGCTYRLDCYDPDFFKIVKERVITCKTALNCVDCKYGVFGQINITMGEIKDCTNKMAGAFKKMQEMIVSSTILFSKSARKSIIYRKLNNV